MVVSWVLEFKFEIFKFGILEVDKVGVNLFDGFLERFFKGMINGYNFINRFYGVINVMFDVLEFG